MTKAQTPDGQWLRCDGCNEILYRKTLEANFYICTRCGHHFRIPPQSYIEILLDEANLDELDPRLSAGDPLRFPQYKEKLRTTNYCGFRRCCSAYPVFSSQQRRPLNQIRRRKPISAT